MDIPATRRHGYLIRSATLRILALGFFAASLSLVPIQADATAAGPRWTTQRVGGATWADDYSATRTFIELDSSSQPVILYSKGPNKHNGFDLRMARGPLPDGSFQVERIDPTDKLVTGYQSLALSHTGRAHVSYVSGVFLDQGILKHAVRGSSGWTDEVVDPITSVGQTSMTVGPGKRPVIAYTRVNAELRLAMKQSGEWTISPVSGEQVVALDVAINAAGHPEIAYVAWDGANYVARLAIFDGTSWSFETAGHVSTQGIEFGIDLLIDAEGNEDLVFPVLEPDRGIARAHSTGSGWELELIATGNLWQSTPTYDANGGLHVVYYDAEPGALRYGQLVAGQWELQTIRDSKSPNRRIGRQSSIVLDEDGRAHVSYYVGEATKGTTIHYAVSSTDEFAPSSSASRSSGSAFYWRPPQAVS